LAIRAAAELSAKHINERMLPDKAIDVLDEAGAADRMREEAKRHRKVTARDVERVVARMAKIPEQTVSADDQAALAGLEPELKKVIFGQDKAIEAISSPAPPAWARPSSPSSWPASWASSSCAST
jgi:ATP-dependent Clp protease ATP-binding subunit ClpA